MPWAIFLILEPAIRSPSQMKPQGRPFILVTTSFPISRDGSEAAGGFVADLAMSLSLRVPVVVVAPGTDERVEEWSGSLSVHRYPAPAQALSTLRPWHPRDVWRILKVLRAGSRVTRHAVRNGAAHVLALWALPSGYWARGAARQAGVSYSVWTLGSDIWSLGRIPVVRGVLARVLADAGQRFSDGLKLLEDTREICKAPVTFLPSTRNITTSRAEPIRHTDPYRLVFIGRWHENKGVDLLLDALSLLDVQTWSRIESVDIYGGGPLEADVRRRAGELAVLHPVRAHGYLAKDQSERALADADFVLIPSRIESIPVVFSDAMKFGCPVITMPVGDLPVLVAEGTGVCAADVTPQAFARAMTSALSNGPGRYEAGLQEMARRFSNEHAVVPALMLLVQAP